MRSSLTKRRNLRQIAAVLLLSLTGCGSNSNRVREEAFERIYAIEPTANVSIQNRDGAVLVYGSNANEIRVRATKKAYSRTRLREIAIDVAVEPTSASINVKLPPKPTWALFDHSGTVDCTVVVPATANISMLRLDAGEVLLDGLRGRSAHAWLGDGRMIAHNCFTDVDLRLQRGNLSVAYDWWEHGTFSVQANVVRGNTWAFLPTDAAFHLIAETTYGKISNDFDNPAVARPTFAEAAKIDILVHGGENSAIKVRTANGDIRIVEANP